MTLSDIPPIYFGPEMVFFDGQTRYKVVILNTLDGIIVDTVLALFKNVYFVWELSRPTGTISPGLSTGPISLRPQGEFYENVFYPISIKL